MSTRTDAVLSADGIYRYELTRMWSDLNAFLQRPLTFIMLNPSTADAEVDDPTIRRCMGFARREGLDGIRVVNLYALRATDPKALRGHPDPVGPENDHYIRKALLRAYNTMTPVVCAWGTSANPDRIRYIERLIARGETSPCGCTTRAVALGVTKDGHPRHPLYVKSDQPLVRWPVIQEDK